MPRGQPPCHSALCCMHNTSPQCIVPHAPAHCCTLHASFTALCLYPHTMPCALPTVLHHTTPCPVYPRPLPYDSLVCCSCIDTIMTDRVPGLPKPSGCRLSKVWDAPSCSQRWAQAKEAEGWRGNPETPVAAGGERWREWWLDKGQGAAFNLSMVRCGPWAAR